MKSIFSPALEELARAQGLNLAQIELEFVLSYRHMILILFAKFSSMSSGSSDLEQIGADIGSLIKSSMRTQVENFQEFFDPNMGITVSTNCAEEALADIDMVRYLHWK